MNTGSTNMAAVSMNGTFAGAFNYYHVKLTATLQTPFKGYTVYIA